MDKTCHLLLISLQTIGILPFQVVIFPSLGDSPILKNFNTILSHGLPQHI
jgi:hypothetical protein